MYTDFQSMNFRYRYYVTDLNIDGKSKVKQSRYTPWRRLGGEEVQLLLILDLGTRWG
jgi:hypothetical protein